MVAGPYATADQAKSYAGRALGTGSVRRAYEHLEEELERRLRDGAPKVQVVDVGCGDGKLTAALATRFPSCNFVGVDRAEAMITHACEVHRLPNIAFRTEDMTLLHGLADASCDIVYSVSATHYAVDQAAVFGALVRVLRSDGLLWLSTYPSNPSEFAPVLLLIHSDSDVHKCFFDEDTGTPLPFAHIDAFPLDAPLGHLEHWYDPDSSAVETYLSALGLVVHECRRERRSYRLLGGVEDYAKMLAPWHPWIACVRERGGEALLHRFLAQLSDSYREWLRACGDSSGAADAQPPFVFDTVYVSARKTCVAATGTTVPPQCPPPSGRLQMISPDFSGSHFTVEHVDFYDPDEDEHMTPVRLPIASFETACAAAGIRRTDAFDHFGFEPIALTPSEMAALQLARGIALKDLSTRTLDERMYMENNLGLPGEFPREALSSIEIQSQLSSYLGVRKRHGAAQLLEHIVRRWAESRLAAQGGQLRTLASHSVKIRESLRYASSSRATAAGGGVDPPATALGTGAAHVRPQPHVHVDYTTRAAALRRLARPPEWSTRAATDVPPEEELWQVVNIWLPMHALGEAVDDGFGFVVGGESEVIPVYVHGAEFAANVRLRRSAEATLVEEPCMGWGRAWIFKSVLELGAPPHSAFARECNESDVDRLAAVAAPRVVGRKSLDVRVAVYYK
ncbi:hypothetical protein EMIHUDRAFT_208642 [Emiliania huxleyi CCMP1516]|uniref:Methyltransferase type 11 domain-containing protein n=2 Tax=Emiliania huxleyi TaxID=2903 RepID=A0A0D3J8U6_EMIH1|nr:hypothetical protein EMIHUDRAFT_208642 [Emiliania huxleyi CCMP1516]EOD19931.1 hypothetical protein EMIHUDRAFT_208642 [Emiliania huxleyi CCMP1516]|eukprot:XP_005772360.1 hypothetical protein EMIHUDRAFT_208642 [Emiliania huxleyi CCMP1516]